MSKEKPYRIPTQNDLDELGVRIKRQGPSKPTEAEMEEARRNPLPPADSNRSRVRTYVTMDPDARRIAKRIGNGVISRGIDRALFHFADCRKVKRVKRNG